MNKETPFILNKIIFFAEMYWNDNAALVLSSDLIYVKEYKDRTDKERLKIFTIHMYT